MSAMSARSRIPKPDGFGRVRRPKLNPVNRRRDRRHRAPNGVFLFSAVYWAATVALPATPWKQDLTLGQLGYNGSKGDLLSLSRGSEMRLLAAFWVVISLVLIRPSWSAPASFQHSYALVIGIDNYAGEWSPLRHARHDAASVANYLGKQGFEVMEYYDRAATKGAILSGFSQLAGAITSEDRVLIFFAGHGHTVTDGAGDHGFIVPWDGSTDLGTLISMEELERTSTALSKARHQLFIMDSCYSGLAPQEEASLKFANPDYLRPDYVDRVAGRTARQIITAGTKGQQVIDGGAEGHSLFTGTLLDGLNGMADQNGDGYV
jgi:Caspase domain